MSVKKNKLSSLIDIGSCNLYLIHGAFKTGSEKSSWDLHKILKRAFKLLHDSPVRREYYFNLTGYDEYPLQFCGTRWVEDKKGRRKVGKQEQHHTEVTSITNYKIHHQTVMNTGIK